MDTDPTPSPGSSLLEAYRRWKMLQASPPGSTEAERTMTYGIAKAAAEGTARQMAVLAQAGDIETTAHRKGVARVAKAVDAGASPTAALAAGYRRYRKHGGSASLRMWQRRVANGGAK